MAKTNISTPMRASSEIKGNASLTPDAGVETQYYGKPNPVELPKPQAGTGVPLNGRINKNMGSGAAKTSGQA